MKKNLKGTIATLLALTLLGTALTGCGNSSAPSDSAESPSSSGSKKEITVWHIQTNGDAKEPIENAVNRFMADNPEYDVIVEPILNDSYKTKLKVAMGSDTMPDVFIHWTGGPMIEYINAGKMLDLTDYMNKDGFKDRFLDGAISQTTYDGKIWGVPAENIAVATFFYNKEMFETYNLEVPKTISELEKVCDTLLENGIAPFSLANKNKWTGSMYYMYLVNRFGGTQVFADAANRENGGSFESEAFTQAGEKLQDWVRRGYFVNGFNGLDEDNAQARNILYAGKGAMYLMGSWTIGNFKNEDTDFYENKVGSFPFPAVDGSSTDPNDLIGTIGDNFFAISKNSKDPDGAFKVISYMTDDQAMNDRLVRDKLPPIKGNQVDDNPLLAEVLGYVNNSKNVQLWYDQYLSPEMSELHKDTSQALFALDKTPEEVNKEMEKLMSEQ